MNEGVKRMVQDDDVTLLYDAIQPEEDHYAMGICMFDKYAEACIVGCENIQHMHKIINRNGEMAFPYDYDIDREQAYAQLFDDILGALGQWKSKIDTRIAIAIPSSTPLIQRKSIQVEIEKRGFCGQLVSYSEVIPYSYLNSKINVDGKELKVLQILKCSDEYEIITYEIGDGVVEVWNLIRVINLSPLIGMAVLESGLNYADIQMVVLDKKVSDDDKDIITAMFGKNSDVIEFEMNIAKAAALRRRTCYLESMLPLDTFPTILLAKDKKGNFTVLLMNDTPIPCKKKIELKKTDYNIRKFSIYEVRSGRLLPKVVGTYDLTKLLDEDSIGDIIQIQVEIEWWGSLNIILSTEKQSCRLPYWKEDLIEEDEDTSKYIKEIFTDLLPALDNLDRSIAYVREKQDESLGKGLEAVKNQIMDVFARAEIRPINALNQPFSVKYHNALMHDMDETKGENLVVEELQKGYMYKDEVIRHSLVKVVN